MVKEELFKCVLSGDLESMKQLFEGKSVTEELREQDLFEKKDEVGRNALLTASLMGRSDIVQELVRYGARVNEQTVRGYSSLHLVACWGHVETVRTLLELGAKTQAKTFRGERPVDLARRYFKTDCADCLILAEAKQDLMSYISSVQEIITGSGKNLTKEEEAIFTQVCSVKFNWIQSVKNPTFSDLMGQRKDIEETLHPILGRLSAQTAEMPVKPPGKV